MTLVTGDMTSGEMTFGRLDRNSYVMTVQAHKVSSLTRLSCKIMADKAKRHDQDSSSECDSSEDSRNNDQKQARKKTKKYKTRYSKEWEKTYPFLKACPTSVSEKEYKFYCSCCISNLPCAQGGMSDVAKHASKD